jgi:hypothetical protein
MGEVAAATAAGGGHGFPLALSTFAGRAGELDEVAGLLGKYRLVTVAGPGGVGKTGAPAGNSVASGRAIRAQYLA